MNHKVMAVPAKITCPYCRGVNDRTDDRCMRCGRRMHRAAPQAAPNPYPIRETPARETPMREMPMGEMDERSPAPANGVSASAGHSATSTERESGEPRPSAATAPDPGFQPPMRSMAATEMRSGARPVERPPVERPNDAAADVQQPRRSVSEPAPPATLEHRTFAHPEPARKAQPERTESGRHDRENDAENGAKNPVENDTENGRPTSLSASAGAASPSSGATRQETPRQDGERTYQQPALFRDPNPRRVVPIPTLTPTRPVEREAPARRGGTRSPARPARRVADTQQELEFQDAEALYGPNPEETIYCDAPVAHPWHRMAAAAVDGGLVLLGVLLFLAVFLMSGGEMAFDRVAAFMVLGVIAIVSALYRSLWAIVNEDTPGLRAVGLRLVDFDGRRPRRNQRAVRQIASVLSLLSATLGLVWALLDEESLTWHDHISKSFPTER